MTMENPFEGKEVWFGVGSQDLYGEEALRQVAEQSGEIVDALNATGKIPVKIVLKPTLKSSDGVKAFIVDASAKPTVIGVITWRHTFYPAKMWTRGPAVLTQPLHTFHIHHHRPQKIICAAGPHIDAIATHRQRGAVCPGEGREMIMILAIITV